jgi:DNA-binding PadR family transcriptional regulator
MTSTSYAVLGLLAARPATSYDLAKQVRRSLAYFWPRAERMLYEEPKRLVEAGYASTSQEQFGRRTRTVYSITDDGRTALAGWLAVPPVPPSFELEGILKVFFAEDGDLAALRATLATIEDQAEQTLRGLAAMCFETVTDRAEYPDRIHINALVMRLAIDIQRLHVQWAHWALEQVAGWDDTRTPARTWRDTALAVFEDGATSGRPAR